MPLVSIADLNGPPEEVAACIEQAKALSALYENYLATEEDKSDRPPGLHASEIAGCLRQAVYTLLATEKRSRPSSFWRRKFKMGHAVHEMVQDDFQRLARRTQATRAAADLARRRGWRLSFEPEVPIAPHLQPLAARLSVYSKCDGVFTFHNAWTDEPVLRVGLEIKTQSPGDFEKLKEPVREHLLQTHLYMRCLDLPLMWLFYFSKGTQNNTESLAPFLVPFDPDVWQEVETRCLVALEAGARGELPAREESIRCDFCPYVWGCQPTRLHPRSAKSSFALPRATGR